MSEQAPAPMTGSRGHRAAWLLVLFLLVVALGVIVAVVVGRGGEPAEAPVASEPGPPVLINAQIWQLAPGRPGVSEALADAGAGNARSTSRLSLESDEVVALVASLQSIGAPGASLQSAPRVAVAAGESATITVGSSTTDAQGREVARDTREISYLPTLTDDGLVRLDAEVWMRSADGRVQVMMEDLGLAVGQRRVRRQIPAMSPDGAAAIWIPDGDEGWLVLIQAAPMP